MKREDIEKVFSLNELKVLKKRAESHPESIPEKLRETIEIIKQIVNESSN